MKLFEPPYLYVLIGISVLILVVLLLLIFRKKQPKSKVVDTILFDKVFVAIGENNILNVEKQQDRVRFLLKDVKKIDSKAINELKIPAFLKGNEVKLLFRENSNELVNYINAKLKE